MVKVDEYARIRRAHAVDGLSIRDLARRFHHSRRKIAEILSMPEPKPYVRLNPPPSMLDPFKPIIDALLEADEQAPRKQRHTAAKLYRRLRAEHGYGGSYERVRVYVRNRGRQRRETFIPLDHDPGQRVEVDFGHIYVDLPTGRQLIPVLVMTWAYSNCTFAMALPTERTEAILHGMCEGFLFFGCVSQEVWWDNPTTVVPHLFKGRQRQLHERYQALASHCNFEPLFCLARRPQEKPRVEGRVQFLQQDWATPVPQMPDLAALNVHLRDCCLRDRERTQAGRRETIGQRFEQERSQALPLPERAFDACIFQPAKVDKYQTVRFDRNAYSLPRCYAYQLVTVKGYADHVAIVAAGQVVARHQRSYAAGEQVLDPLHYLVMLGRRPAALDHANVYRHWQLPPVFAELRADLERQRGPTTGAREYIRVLQLLGEHPVERVQRAIGSGRIGTGYALAAIVQSVQRLAECSADDLKPSDCPSPVQAVDVPLPDLRQFDQFLSGEEVTDVRNECVVGESQPEATASAGDACRV
jgi:transposase